MSMATNLVFFIVLLFTTLSFFRKRQVQSTSIFMERCVAGASIGLKSRVGVRVLYCIFVLLEESIDDRTQQLEQANLTKVHSR